MARHSQSKSTYFYGSIVNHANQRDRWHHSLSCSMNWSNPQHIRIEEELPGFSKACSHYQSSGSTRAPRS